MSRTEGVDDKADDVLTSSRVRRVGLCLGLASLPCLFADRIVRHVTALHDLEGPAEFFPTDHPLLYALVVPVVALSVFSFFLAPGALIALAWSRVQGVCEWFLLSVAASIVLAAGLGTTAKLVLGTPLDPAVLMTLWVVAGVVAWGVALRRVRRPDPLPWPLARRRDRRRLIAVLAVSAVAVYVLLPKIFWESFNIDGIEAYEYSRSLTRHVLPYAPLSASGVFGIHYSFVSFAWPGHWFLSLLDAPEAAMRLPFVLWWAALFAGVVCLVEHRSRRLGAVEECAVWAGLVVFGIVQSFGTSYDPFFCDLAEPAGTDTLWILLFLGTCHSAWTGRWRWFWAFGLLNCMASPGGQALLGAFLVATLLAGGEARCRGWLPIGALTLVWLLVGVLYQYGYCAHVLEGFKGEFAGSSLVQRMRPLRLTEFARLNTLLFPSGLIPAVALVFILVRPRRDVAATTLGLVTLAFFAVIYCQNMCAVHQFAPVMVLPLVVFWRLFGGVPVRVRRPALALVFVGAAVAGFLSLPRHFHIDRETREFGAATSIEIPPSYDADYAEFWKSGVALDLLLPTEYRLAYPDQPWSCEWVSWLHHAARPKAPETIVNYVVRPADEPGPPGAERVGIVRGFEVWVIDPRVWEAHRAVDRPRRTESPLYERLTLQRTALMRAWAVRHAPAPVAPD